EGGDPAGRVAVAGYHRGEARVALDEELVDVAALLAGHRLQREVVDDEDVDSPELGHEGIPRVVHPTLLEHPQEHVSPEESDVEAGSAADVSQPVREEGLADPDGP